MRRRLSLVPDLPPDAAATLLGRPPRLRALACFALSSHPEPWSLPRCACLLLLEAAARVALGLAFLSHLLRGLLSWVARLGQGLCARPPSQTMHQRWLHEMAGRGLCPSPDRSIGHSRKILVLDLDETLVHSTVRPHRPCYAAVDVFTDTGSCTLALYTRPHLPEFLEKVAQWYHVYIFTAGVRGYADPIINRIDSTRTVFARRFYREDCTRMDACFVKDLRKVHHHMGSVILVDNSDVSFQLQPDNGVPIPTWLGDDPHDTALLSLLPLLDALRHTRDVRSLLSLRPSATPRITHV